MTFSSIVAFQNRFHIQSTDFNLKTLYLFVCIFRQKISAGMSLNELSEFIIFIGCHEVLNLDGGKSITMIIKNKIVTSPSDPTGERSIGNALLLLTK